MIKASKLAEMEERKTDVSSISINEENTSEQRTALEQMPFSRKPRFRKIKLECVNDENDV